MRNELGEHVRVHHDDNAYNRGERYRMPEDEPEDRTFLPDLVGGGGGDADGLRVDHFAHDAAGGIRGCHQDGAETELLRGNFCKPPKRTLDDVSLPVRATPSQPINEPKKGKNQPVRVKASPSTASMPE